MEETDKLIMTLVKDTVRDRSILKEGTKKEVLERKNPDIVMPVCKVGCDDFFEKGYILVNSNGAIKANPKMEYSSELRKII